MVCTCLYPSLVQHVTSENIQYRILTSSPKYRAFMMHITRCILDAGWGRGPSTINNHLLEVKINFTKFKYIGNLTSYLSLNTHLVKDLLGMGPAVDMLMYILDPGRLSVFAQFDNSRSSWSDFSTVWEDSIKGVLEGASLEEDHGRKTVLANFSTQTI